MYFATGERTGKIYASSNEEKEVFGYIQTMNIPFPEKINVVEEKYAKEFKISFFFDKTNRQRSHQTVMRLDTGGLEHITDILLSKAFERWKKASTAPVLTLKDHKSRHVSFILDDSVELAVGNYVRQRVGYHERHLFPEIGTNKNVKLLKLTDSQTKEFHEILKQENNR